MKRVLALALALMLLASCALAEEPTAGAQSDQVLEIQQQLAAMGYLNSAADGIYGADTATAVAAFQQANGLMATGELNAATLAALASGGQSGVASVQQQLIDLGYLEGEADGIFGAQTASALSRFQRDQGLTASGSVDNATLAALMGEAEEAVEAASHADPSGVAQYQQRLIDLGFLSGNADGIFGEQTAAAVAAFQQANGLSATGQLDDATKSALFSDAARGDDVRAFQQRLIDLGYLSGTADGIFGPQSEAATRAFQQLSGLPVTGTADDATRAALFADGAASVRPALKQNDKGDAVQELQQRLIVLGFLSDGADGIYGEKTAAAVAAFQNHLIAQGLADALGIAATGEATPLTQAQLFSDSYSSYLSDVTPGAECAEAARVERRLRSLGYLDAEPDASFDSYASAALAAFQSGTGLTATGAADRATVDALFSADAAQAAHFAPHDVAMGDTCGSVGDAQRALISLGLLAGLDDGSYGSDLSAALERLHSCLTARGSDSAALFADSEALSAEALQALLDGDLLPYAADIEKGADASETARLQRRLYSLFYLTAGGVDGDFGGNTRAAVEAFQTNNGLPVTGVGDEATQRALFADDAIGSWTQYKLVIRTDEQRVYVYQLNDEKRYEQIDTFICSTGLGDLTPAGIYSSTTAPLDRWHYFYKFDCWAQYAWRITGPYYFHSVLYSERDESTLRVSSVYNLGHKASHGCVRLSVEDAKWIYENCAAGTIVVIY
ncbi:MAG: peptidoglycan-binding protein [Candidatus Faecivicinus sp.]